MLIDCQGQIGEKSDKERIAWQNSYIICHTRINKIIQNGVKNDGVIPDWAGFHLFGRYQTENDLYVASVRMDGNVVIKKKKDGEYLTLKMMKGGLSEWDVGRIFKMKFQITNNEKGGVCLCLFVNDVSVLETEDNTNVIKFGTHGIRIDYCDTDIFSLAVGPA
jgi:hypothetical protein